MSTYPFDPDSIPTLDDCSADNSFSVTSETPLHSSNYQYNSIAYPFYTIAYKKFRDNNNEPVFKPTKRKEDADYDIYASIDTLCKAGVTTPVSTNLAIEFPEGWEGKIETKSGLGKKGLTVFGGVIDQGYRGELVILIHNTSKEDYLFKSGHKVAQLKLRQVSPHFEFHEVQRTLKESERKDGGFGSTGI